MTKSSTGRSGGSATGRPAWSRSRSDGSGGEERWVEPLDGDELDADPVVEEHGVLTIDCGTCELRHTTACGDCLVSFVCDRRAGEAVVIDVAEARAIRLLGSGGLIPTSRHRRRTG